MNLSHPRDPLHGITLETIVKELVEQYGWAEMGRRVPIRCFLHDPSVKSSLTFLRKTPWARERVEGWYIAYKDERLLSEGYGATRLIHSRIKEPRLHGLERHDL